MSGSLEVGVPWECLVQNHFLKGCGQSCDCPSFQTASVAQEAVRDALIPNMDQTRSTGVVTLPGAFIGALFGGSSPLEAARFQVVVLVGIMLAQTLTAIVVTRRLSRMTTLPPPEG